MRYEGDEEVRDLIGNVHFVQPSESGGDVEVWSDRALRFMKRNRIELYGNVRIERGGVLLTSSEGIYYGNESRAEMTKGVRLRRSSTVLTARIGNYYTEDRIAHFQQNVVVIDTNYRLEADELYYYETDQMSIAVGHVRMDEYPSAITVLGDSVIHDDERQYVLVPVNPLLIQVDTSAANVIDTLVVKSRIMEGYVDSTKRFIAIDSVKMARSDLSAKCGRAVFNRNRNTIALHQEPIVWHQENQISGDSIIVTMRNNILEQVHVIDRAVAVSRADSARRARFNQLTGREITFTFGDNEVQRIDVEWNATSLYYLYDETVPNGMNRSSGDRIEIRFEEGVVDEISVKGGVEGTYFPERIIKNRESDYNLEGFRWITRRPVRQGITIVDAVYE